MYNYNRQHSTQYIINFFDGLIEANVTVNAFKYLFEHYSKEVEKEALVVLWKYYGGMFQQESDTTEGQRKQLNEAFELYKTTAISLNASDDFIEYMSRAFRQ
jgi:hypothetical protein